MVAGEGMHSCRGACVVARGWGGGHAWLPGACVVARRRVWLGGHMWLPGGMHGCQGVCMVAGGHVWLWGGGHVWDTMRYGQ